MSAGPIFVRHGRSIVQPGVPPSRWPLDPEHLDDVDQMVRRLPPRPVIVSSDYRRALDTASRLGTATPDPRLREVSRPWTDDFDSAIARYLDGEPVSGWESQDDVVGRIGAVVEERGRDAVYVGHGTAMTLYISRHVADLAPFEFWTQLGQPDAWYLGGALARV